METRASHVAVGAFVVLLSAALVAAVVWIGKVQLDRATDVYLVRFEGAVSGLQPGSPVQYLGLPVGTVTDLRIDPADPSRVQATVEVRQGTPIKADSVAQLELQSLAGGSFVQIAPGSAGAPDLADAPWPRVIPSRPSSIAAVVDATPELLANLVRLSAQLNDLLAEDNQRAVAATLANLAEASGELAGLSRRLGGALETGERAAGEAGALVSSLAELLPALVQEARWVVAGFDETTRLVNDEIPGAGQGLRALLSSLDAVGRQLGQVVRENREPLRDFTGTGLYEVTALLAELRQLAASLTRFTVQLERDPTGALIRGTRGGVETAR